MCGTCRSVPASVSITVCLSWIHKSTACTYSCHVTALNSHLLAAAVRHSVALTHARKHNNSPTRSELAAGVWQLHIVAEKSTRTHTHTDTDTVAACVWEGTRTTHWDSVIFDIVRFNNLNSSRLLPVTLQTPDWRSCVFWLSTDFDVAEVTLADRVRTDYCVCAIVLDNERWVCAVGQTAKGVDAGSKFTWPGLQTCSCLYLVLIKNTEEITSFFLPATSGLHVLPVR